ncbi:MAG: GTP-binding protein [Candidatus Korarchaeota archaeon]
MSSDEKPHYVFKIVLLGDGAVGKTSLVRRYVEKTFQKKYIMTIGVDFYSKRVEIDGEQVLLVIWDLAGQPMFNTVRSSFYSGSRGGILVFDLTRESTLPNLHGWLNELRKHAPDAPVILIGNKADLADAREVSPAAAKKFAKEIGCEYLETSALDGSNVNDAFEIIARKILQQQKVKK